MMTKKLLFVTLLLLVLAIASVDLVVDVSAQPGGENPHHMADQPTDAATKESWAGWAKKQFSGVIGGGSKNDDESSSSPTASPSSSPTASPPIVGA